MAAHFIESLKETLQLFRDEYESLGGAVQHMEAMLASMAGTAAPKLVGRAASQEIEAPAPKRRGRPPGKASVGAAVPKRRGRPPGSKNKPKVAEMEAPVKRKPGRPKWTPEQRQAAAERLARGRAAKARAAKAAAQDAQD